jgi:hypothetical protein
MDPKKYIAAQLDVLLHGLSANAPDARLAEKKT